MAPTIAAVQSLIQQKGSVPFSLWMEACLYGEDGYYQAPKRKTGVSDGDFATSPTLHPFFGAAVADEILRHWQDLGAPDRYVVNEWGGGEGDLARAALARIDQVRPDVGNAIVWQHTERSADHRSKQGGDPRLTWGDGPSDFVVANELLDAMPFDIAEFRGTWLEARVGAGRLVYDTAPKSWKALLPDHAQEGQRVAIMQEAWRWFDELDTKRLLIADYGSPHCWKRDKRGTIRTFANHQDAGDPLQEPGSKDITASIDWARMHDVAWEHGWAVVSDESQEEFLLRHGALEAMNDIDKESFEGARSYLRLRQLVLPTGLGRAFRVAVLDRAA